jgi:hypothetical protein
MARFSNQFIQGLGNPSYGQGLFDLGKNIAGTPMLMRQEKDRKEQQAQVMKILQENSDDAPILNAQSRKYQAQGNDELAKVFSEAAQQAVTKSTRRGEIADESRARADVRAEAVGKKVDAQGAELQRYALEQNATNVAKKMIKDPNQLQATLAGLRGASDEQLRTFLKEASKPKERKTQLMSPGSQLVDTATGNVITKAPFKPTEPKAPKIETVKTDDFIITFTDGKETGRVPLKDMTEQEGQVNFKLINKTNDLLTTIASAKDKVGFFSSGMVGQGLQYFGGRDAQSLRANEYKTLSGQEAFREIQELKEASEKYGSKGTGLGQITQIEFSALQSNLAALSPEFSEEDQLKNLEAIEKNLIALQRMASGEDYVDVIDWEQPNYVSAGYTKGDNGNLFYFPRGTQDKYVYNRETGKFDPLNY